jgi:PAS domain S-box-containing protein
LSDSGRPSRGEIRDQLAQFIDQTAARARTFQLIEDPDLLAEATMAELLTSLEELRVTEEELRAQNEALDQALREIERERARYQRLFEQAPDGYVVTDRGGLILDSNAAAASLFGRDPVRLMHKPLAVLVAPASRPVFRDLLNSIVNENKNVKAQLRLESKNAAPATVTISATADLDADGQTIVRWILRDVTELSRARKTRRMARRERLARIRLQKTVRRLRFMAATDRALRQHTPEAVAQALVQVAARFLVDDCEVVCKDGEQWRSLARHSRNPVIGERADALRLTLRFDAADGPLAGVLKQGSACLFPPLDTGTAGTRELLAEVRAATPRFGVLAPAKVGDTVLGALCVFCVGDRQLSPEEIGVALDLGNRLGVALDQQRLKREAEAGALAKSQFLSVVSHELRTPLSAVIGYAELLLEGIAEPLQPTARQWVERVLISARHQARLVNDLLMYTRFDRAPEKLSLHLVSAQEIVNDAVAVVRPVIDESGLAVNVNVAEISLRTDPHKVMQILINLLWNAQKFTRSGTISISAEQQGDEVWFSVSDTGIGIAEADLPRVFEPFWQSDQSDTRVFGGAGLGLAVSRKIADQLGGQLDVTSELGKGSTFTLRVPQLGPEAAPA